MQQFLGIIKSCKKLKFQRKFKMKEKTKLIIIEKIARRLSLEESFTQYQKLAVWTSYFMEIGVFQICLLISIAEPQLHLRDQLSQNPSLQLVLFFLRIAVSVLYFITTSCYVIPVIKMLQIINVYLVRTQFCAIPLIFQLAAQLYVTIRKEKRRVNFDSRLQSKYFGTKVLTIYILLFCTFVTSTEQISKNSSAVLFTSVIFYISASLDNIYSYRTKEILRNIALCPVLLSVYFICEPLVPVLSTFGLVAHTLLSLCIFLVIMVYAVSGEYSYHHEVLYKKILNLESRDKLLYIWSLIYFIESATQSDLVRFIKTHQSKCFNSLCPLNFTHNSSNLSPQVIKKSIKIYLNKALQRFASQSDEIRRLFIFYRKEDEPKIVHLLREDDVYEKVEEYRIGRNLERYEDPSLQYEQMKEVEQQTVVKVKLFLNHYDYFLSYINKESIKMETAEQVIMQLLKLKSYFLSFQPNKKTQLQQDKKLDIPKKTITKNSRGYQKIQSETIPAKKMSLKTIALVNIMRKVYFNLPSLEKEELQTKKLTQISEDLEQSPILIISAESYNLGKIINWNSMAQKILLYSTKEMRSKFVNDLIPKSMHKIHQKIFLKAALLLQVDEVHKQLEAYVFCFTKASYAEVFEAKIQGSNTISGSKWVVELKHQYDNQAVVIVDEYRNVVGINKNAINFGITLNVSGETFNQDLFNRLMEHKKGKLTLDKSLEPIEGVKMQKQTQWQLASSTPFIQGLAKFFILLVQETHEIQKTTLSRFTKKDKTLISPQHYPQPSNGFEFNFDPFLLKFTNQQVIMREQTDLQLIWQENQQIGENSINSQYLNNKDEEKKIKKYDENIHEMIYFDKKLEFKENYDVATEFETHPSYLLNGKMNTNKNTIRLNINKENFMENVSKIKEKIPPYVYKLSFLFIIVTLICIVLLSVRWVQYRSLFNSAKEKQLVNAQIINRRNLIDNIGSLAVYIIYVNKYPYIWDRYVTNGWTFEELFVEIEYTNAKINNLNHDIGFLVNKGYLLNGKSRTLASYFEALSIQASARSSGQLNLTQFIAKIVGDIQDLQIYIKTDVESYYNEIQNQSRMNILIIDVCKLVAFIVCCIIMHFILRKAYIQKVHLFKSLSAIEEEEISRIQKNLSDLSQQIKNNQLDIVIEDDYSEPIDSQSITHSKKMLHSYIRSKIIYFYVLILINLVMAGFSFLVSQNQHNKIKKVELLTPFVNIVGERRDSMTKMYLDVIGNTKNSSEIQYLITQNTRMFQSNKKGVIDSLIAQQFSDSFLAFYNEIWFNPCDILGVQPQCSSLFSGILSGNLDYNFAYILTEIQKIIEYRIQMTTPPTSNDPQFIKDAIIELQRSFRRINFLLFDLMIRLQSQFNEHTESEISFLHKKIQKESLYIFIGGIIWVIVSILLLMYMVYMIKDLPNKTLQMVTTAVPYSILMRNQYFVQWYKKKFKNVY